MATRLLSPIIIKCKSSVIWTKIKCVGNFYNRKLHTETKGIPVKELQIPVKWGHISAKLWGTENEQPILALHGWQDNADTWEPLAPFLTKKRPILAIDLPGHGLSSWYPPGMQYYPWDLPQLILYIKEYFKWNKVLLLSHSMGSMASLRFAAVYPEDVDFYIAIDTLITDEIYFNPDVEDLPKLLRKTHVVHSRLEEEPPAYKLEELAKMWHFGTNKSLALDSVYRLLKRGAKESARNPGIYYFSRDPRVKTALIDHESKTFVEALVRRLKCPTLYIKAIDSPYSLGKFSVEMRNVIEKNNDKFECHFVAGTHYVHLNDPDKVAPLIISFLNRYSNLAKEEINS